MAATPGVHCLPEALHNPEKSLIRKIVQGNRFRSVIQSLFDSAD